MCPYNQTYFTAFSGFSRWLWSKGQICYISMNMVIGVSETIILSRSIRGIRARYVGDRGGVNCSFIINFIFLLFLVFQSGGGVGDKFAISQ